ncbi:MAG: hypothetical protein WC365_04355 [Candidatus Babeliales bacterium]|jgi:hypothetical protein
MPQIIGRATKTSANAYASVFTNKPRTDAKDGTNVVFHCKENNVNAVTLKFLGSNDGTNFETLEDEDGTTEFAVSKNGSEYHTVTDAWLYLDVQVKSTVAETHGSITIVVTQG